MKLYVAAILAVSFLDLFNEGIVRGSVGSQIMPWDHCIDLSSKEMDIRRIAKYEEQETPIKAVILINNRGIRICVKHDLPWVQRAIKSLKRRSKPRAQKPRKPSSRGRAMSTSRSMARTS